MTRHLSPEEYRRASDLFNALLDVPAGEAERVVEQVDGSEVAGRRLRLEPVRG